MIAGLVPCSFVDYPGRVAAVLFLQGCNLKCPYCHNPHLIAPRQSNWTSFEETASFLRDRRGRLSGVVISGGEPTLHAGLAELIREIRNHGYVVKLDTNGTRPATLRSLLDQSLLDYVAMDLKDLPQRYGDWLSNSNVAEAILESVGILRVSRVEHEFRTTMLHPRHDIETLDGLRTIIGDDAPWYLQRAHDEVPFRQQGLRCLSLLQIDALASQLTHRGARKVVVRETRGV